MYRFIISSFILLSCLSTSAQMTYTHADYLRHAIYLSELGYHDSAFKVVDALQNKLEPKDTSMQFFCKSLKIEFHTKTGHFTAVVNEYESMIDDPYYAAEIEQEGWFSTYNRLGIAYKHVGQLDKSENSFRKAMKIDPAVSFVYTNLAGTLILKEDYKTALIALDNVSDTIIDVHARATAYKAKCLMLLDSAKAAKDLLAPKMEMAYYKEDFIAQLTMGNIYKSLDMASEACTHFTIAKKHQDLNLNAHPDSNLYLIEIKLKEMMQLEMDIRESCKK